ncbi:hypothetical protein BFU36_11870 [Sulfolobus sp. A20]|uniref:protein kinase domain-containing protein n=1 Tax=Sulfolobaceae TaxID=118883 RepID=UPI00084620E7|nr:MULTISPECIES: protein kinase [unclassified Sulfolobus]TRM76104.1 serine/threonine protein kinase [Sulfolobus sp. E5]TRM83329.1 serine/threonine protein kinase [Sulfolobus sp. A20-N-F6]TRM87431.1 serine/threonine protein kinase [Sulfolobus sp. C3]TRN03878.1 serine/threonine protein kinase [Sulfolobus sp. E1]AOL17288.1 hypothetical protein BFU36_11870 [Sulfolobus sp. A20]
MSSSSSDDRVAFSAFIAVFSFIYTTFYYIVSGFLPAIVSGSIRGDLFNNVLNVVNTTNSPIIYSSSVVNNNEIVRLSLIVYAIFENPVSVLNLSILQLIRGNSFLLQLGGLVNLISGWIFAYLYRRSKGVLISSISLISNSIIQAFIVSNISSDPTFYSLFSISEALLFVIGQVIAGIEFYRENKVKAMLVSFPFFSLLNIIGFGWLVFDASNGSQTYSIGGQSSVSSSMTQNYDVYNALIQALRNRNYAAARMYISELEANGFAIENIFSQLVDDGECGGAIWVMNNYTLDYKKITCNFSSIIDCIINTGRVPKSADSFLEFLDKISVNNAIRLAKYIYYNPKIRDNRRDKAEEILVKHSIIQKIPSPSSIQPSPLPSLDKWDANLWVGKEVYGYTVESVLGMGGTSYVLLARSGNDYYAIKIPILSYSPTQATRVSKLTFEDIYKESSNLQRLSEGSGNVVRIFGIFLDMNLLKRIETGEVKYYLSNPPAIVMEYMGGGSLSGLINEDVIFFSSRWVDILRVVFFKVGKALDYLHKSGYVHLDVKPQNVFFSRPLGRTGEEVYNSLINGNAEVKLGDLGSAKRVGERVTQYTAQYCSIDQVKAIILGKADPSMDVFSFGASLYTALTRRSFNPPELVKLMDDALDDYMRNGSRFLNILKEAEEKYMRYYSGGLIASLSAYPDNFRKVILLTTNPDPSKRPRMDYIISIF